MLKACDTCAIITHCTDSEDLQGKMGRREGTGREGKGRKKGHNTLKYTAGSRTLVDVMKNSTAHTGAERGQRAPVAVNLVCYEQSTYSNRTHDDSLVFLHVRPTLSAHRQRRHCHSGRSRHLPA